MDYAVINPRSPDRQLCPLTLYRATILLYYFTCCGTLKSGCSATVPAATRCEPGTPFRSDTLCRRLPASARWPRFAGILPSHFIGAQVWVESSPSHSTKSAVLTFHQSGVRSRFATDTAIFQACVARVTVEPEADSRSPWAKRSHPQVTLGTG